MRGQSGQPSPAVFDHELTAALRGMDAESLVHAEMSEIRRRHAAGRCTPEDSRRYRACWRALAFRRSAGRRTALPREVDEHLRCRADLVRQIQEERARLAVDAVFGTGSECASRTNPSGNA